MFLQKPKKQNCDVRMRNTMLNILLCDDEAEAAQRLAGAIKALPDYDAGEMQLCCVTDPAAMPDIDFTPYDLVFLDIDMGSMDGIELARRMRTVRTDSILIFVTNFVEYAPEGYEVNAFRYLVKQELGLRLPRYFADALALCRRLHREVEIVCQGEPVPIAVQSLVYVEGLGHEQCLHLKDTAREALYTRKTMAELAALLEPLGFLRVHKSYLVNMAYLGRLRSTGAELTTGETLPVGARSYRENNRKFTNWMVQQL